MFLTGVGKNDIGDGSEACVQGRLHHRVHCSIARSFDANANHRDDHCRKDGDETHNRHIADLFHRPRQR